MIVYGIRPMSRHGQRSSHNNTVLAILPVDMQFEIPCFSENMNEKFEPPNPTFVHVTEASSTVASRRIFEQPAKLSFGPQARSYKGCILSVSQALGSLESWEHPTPPRWGLRGVRQNVLVRFHPNFEGEHGRGSQEPLTSLPLPPTSREDLRLDGYLEYFHATKIVRVQYFVRGGFVGHRFRASSKHLSSHLPVDGVRFLGGQKGVALQLQDARVGVGSNKDADHSRCSEK
ncbi:uncharacterized protein TNCV_3786971 [Trichonephila clavipes]|nr:uncharacterized protein TNCV_3786971 [Trichonephila clavipes]